MSLPSTAPVHPGGANPAAAGSSAVGTAEVTTGSEPILCRHCGRTASNGISCEGHCVADSGY